MYKTAVRYLIKLNDFILAHYFAMGIMYLLSYAIFVYYYPITSQTINNMYLIPLPAITSLFLGLYIIINIVHIKFYCRLIQFLTKTDIGKILNISFSLNFCANIYTLVKVMVELKL